MRAEAKRWLVVAVQAPSDAQRDALTEGLLALGGQAVQEQGGNLITYVREPQDVDAWLIHAGTVLHDAAGENVSLDWHWRADEDWSRTWRRGLRARRVGRSFVVTPSWVTPETHPDDHVIVMDPEMAFGTGEHATTRGVLRLLERVARPGDRVIDVGTGSAILAIGAAQLGAVEVIAVDNDADAILNARDNVTRNKAGHIVRLEVALVDAHYLERLGPDRFDVIMANVLSGVLTPLLPDFAASVGPGGYLILSGILEAEADDMLDAGLAAGFRLMAEDLEAEWWSVLLQRPLIATR